MIRGCLTCPLTTARCQTCAISLLTKVFGLFADEPVCQSLLHRLTSRVDLPTCYDQCNNKQTNLFILSFRLCFHILMKKEKRNKRKPDIPSSKYLTNSKFPLFKSQFANAFKCLTGQFASSFSSLAIKAKLKPA